jgi:hypothetical protein
MLKPLKIRWILAHTPYDLFLRSANAFSAAVKEKTQGAIEVEILGKNEWEQKYNNGVRVTVGEIFRLLSEGHFEMSQMYVNVLSNVNKDFLALDLPFLFKDHDHASRTLDGNIGRYLNEGLTKKSSVRGLAFTYSGGYKFITGNKKISSISDLRGMRLSHTGSPVAEAIFSAVGATSKEVKSDDLAEAIRNGDVDGGEETFSRYYRGCINQTTNTIANTEHALFLTDIVVNNKFWNEQLTEEQRQVLEECAKIAAKEERRESLEDGEQAKAQAIQDNKDMITWTPEAIEEFRQATVSVEDQFRDSFSIKNLVGKIRLA